MSERMNILNSQAQRFTEQRKRELEAQAQELEETITKITELLEGLQFDEVEFDYQEDNDYYFDAYSDAEERVQVKLNDGKAAVFHGYTTDKHMTLEGIYPLSIKNIPGIEAKERESTT